MNGRTGRIRRGGFEFYSNVIPSFHLTQVVGFLLELKRILNLWNFERKTVYL